MAVKLPRLLDSNGAFVRLLHPLDASISEKITPLSTATLELDRGDSIPSRSYVEMYTPYGSAGVYRARSPQDAYGDEITTVELEHAIAEVGDYLVKDKLDGMMAPQKAITEIFKHYKGKRWQLGSITALGTVKIAVQENYTRVLDAMLSVLAQKPGCMLTFNFATNPWTVAIKKRDTTLSAEGRLSRNVSSATVTYDDSELCTRAYYETFSKNKKGETVGKWNYKDADTIKKYGTVEREVPISSDLTDDEVTKTVDNYLEQHKNPRVSVDIDGLELHQITGEDLDKMTIGKLYRLAIAEYSVTVEQNITGIEWSNLYADSIGMRLLLADDEDTIVTFLHDLDAKGGGGGGGGGKKKEEDKWKEYFTRIQQTDYFIGLQANRVDKVNSILEQAGLELNSKGVLIYVKDRKDGNKLTSYIKATADSITQSVNDAVKGLKSEIKIERNRISLVVEGTGKDAKIRTAKIVAGINDQEGSYVKIKADKINLSGYVTMDDMETVNAKIDNLTAGRTTATSLKTNILSASTGFTYQSRSVSIKTVTIDGQSYSFLGV